MDKNEQLEARLEEAALLLVAHGKDIVSDLPVWHHSSSSFDWLVAEILLRRTTRTAAEKAYEDLTSEYQSWEALSRAEQDHIADKVAWVGLGNQRAKHLSELAELVISRHDGELPCDRENLLDLPGIGDYTADAVLLYVCNCNVLPLDGGMQRVLRRVVGRPVSSKTKHTDPYKDPVLEMASDYLIKSHISRQLTQIHRGILSISWSVCKRKPQCNSCPLNRECTFAQR